MAFFILHENVNHFAIAVNEVFDIKYRRLVVCRTKSEHFVYFDWEQVGIGCSAECCRYFL